MEWMKENNIKERYVSMVAQRRRRGGKSIWQSRSDDDVDAMLPWHPGWQTMKGHGCLLLHLQIFRPNFRFYGVASHARAGSRAR